MKQTSKVAEKLEEAFRFPVGSLGNEVRIELSGNRQALVEGCCGIVKYDEDGVELRTVGGVVRLLGRELCMNSLNPVCAMITGRLLSVEFL